MRGDEPLNIIKLRDENMADRQDDYIASLSINLYAAK